MITACPVVSARNRFRSSARRHGSRLSLPMTPLAATAAITASAGATLVPAPSVLGAAAMAGVSCIGSVGGVDGDVIIRGRL
jgi:hypothetical protein